MRLNKLNLSLTWALLLIGAIVMLIPFYIMLVMSLKSSDEFATTSYLAFPRHLEWGNYWKVLTNPNVSFFLFFRNTIVIATLATVGAVITSCLVAYPFARLQFDGKDRLFLLVISTMMLPGIVTMIPNYVLFKYLHWIDTFFPLIVPAYFGGGAFNIFLMRQFLMGIPKELDEAAMIDGASHGTIFWRILLPQAKPALATISVFGFVASWQDFMGPLLYLNDPEKLTLEVGLRSYNSLVGAHYELVMAGAVLVMLPLIIIYFVSQRFFVKGIVMTGIK